MKIASYIATLVVQLVTLTFLKLLDSLELILILFAICGVAGFIVSRLTSNVKLKALGNGIFLGSLTSITLSAAFIIWLYFNFPK